MPAQVEYNKKQLKIELKSRGAQVRRWSKITLCCMLLAFTSGCASYGIVHNKPRNNTGTAVPYSVKTWSTSKQAEDNSNLTSFSQSDPAAYVGRMDITR